MKPAAERRKNVATAGAGEAGYGSGLNTLYFDPDYRRNGKFYTVHIEDPALPGSNFPIAEIGYHTRAGKNPDLPGEPRFRAKAAPMRASPWMPLVSCICTPKAMG